MSVKDKEPVGFVKQDSDDRQLLGSRLKEAREYLGLSQEEVANYLDVPRTALSNIESGKRRIEALELKKLAELYKRSVAYFTGESQITQGMSDDVAHLARTASKLTEGDREELNRFAEFLRARAESRGSSDG